MSMLCYFLKKQNLEIARARTSHADSFEEDVYATADNDFGIFPNGQSQPGASFDTVNARSFSTFQGIEHVINSEQCGWLNSINYCFLKLNFVY